MNLQAVISKIDENQKLIANHGKLSQEILKKIDYKFRLDWNYYSNRMEGGTLTRAETRSVMIGNIEVEGKPFKDVMEMNGHDKTVLEVLKLGKGENRISEKRIKEIHQSIMYEDDPQKKTEIGNWKSKPNELINYKGEKISFTQPLDVQFEIHELLNKTNADFDAFFAQKESKHPLEIAIQFHLDFVTIHPFYDGNGRMSRILTNLILISCGYPPIIIKDNNKNRYYQLLADIQAYGGNPDLFLAFIGERLIESQQVILDAIDGKSIEEEDDIDKEIDLWKKKLVSNDVISVEKSVDSIIQTYEESIRPLFELFISKHEQFKDLFEVSELKTALDFSPRKSEHLEVFARWVYFNRLGNDLKKINTESEESTMLYDKMLEKENLKNQSKTLPDYFELDLNFKSFVKNGVNAFDESVTLRVEFNKYQYIIKKGTFNSDEYCKKLYSEKLTESEINSIVNASVKDFFEKIKSRTETK